MTWVALKQRVVTLSRTPRLLLAQKVLRRVPLRPVDVGKLCFLQLNGLPTVPPAMLRGNADVRFASADDLDALSQLQDKHAVFRARFAEGDRCIVALPAFIAVRVVENPPELLRRAASSQPSCSRGQEQACPD